MSKPLIVMGNVGAYFGPASIWGGLFVTIIRTNYCFKSGEHVASCVSACNREWFEISGGTERLEDDLDWSRDI